LRLLLVFTGALLLAFGIVFSAFYKALDAGFLLDDFSHLGYAYRAWHGDPSTFLKTFTGNWSGQTDGLTSFRPGISTTFVIDYMLHGFSATGYHLTNLIVFTICATLTGLTAFQLTSASFKQRALTASAAALLFIVYPIHAESVAWIVGRVDLFCTLFYMIALCLYFHYRKSERASVALLLMSVASYFISLICKEMSVTLPAAIFFAELLLAKPLNWRPISVKQRVICVGTYFAALLGFGILRTVLLGTVVGGYGNTTFKVLLRSLRNFLDGDTFLKILFGTNEEQQFSTQIKQLALQVAWPGLALALAARLGEKLDRLRVFLFIVLWIAVTELPAFQIWHVFPNLVGSRLFFLGSVAMCVLLAVAIVPTAQLAARLAKNAIAKPVALIAQSIGVVSLTVLAVCWYFALQHNLYAWVEAGRQMHVLLSKLKEETRTLPAGASIVLTDVPQDFAGSGMVGRPEFLVQMLNKPVADANYAEKIITLARPIPGPVEYVYPVVLTETYADSRAAKWFRWDKDERGFVSWARPEGALALALSHSDAWSVDNPKTPQTIWMGESVNLDPFAVTSLQLEVTSKSVSDLKELARNVRLVWRSTKQPKSWIDYSEGPFAEVVNNKLTFLPGRYRSWAINGSIKDIGIAVYPGDYKASFNHLSSLPAPQLIPSLKLAVQTPSPGSEAKRAATFADVILPVVEKGESIELSIDAGAIEKAKSVSVVVTKSNIAASDLPVSYLPDDSQTLFKQQLNFTQGEFKLPAEALTAPGKHQVVVLALDDKNQPVGFTSEPRTFFVK